MAFQSHEREESETKVEMLDESASWKDIKSKKMNERKRTELEGKRFRTRALGPRKVRERMKTFSNGVGRGGWRKESTVGLG